MNVYPVAGEVDVGSAVVEDPVLETSMKPPPGSVVVVVVVDELLVPEPVT